MAEYIKRAAIDFPFLNSGRIIDGKLYVCLDEIYAEVKQLPAADVVPVVHGRWIVTKEYNDVIDMDVAKYTCSACGEYRLSATTLSQATNYCPNCGAHMKEADGNG
jgi:hypothetical protein